MDTPGALSHSKHKRKKKYPLKEFLIIPKKETISQILSHPKTRVNVLYLTNLYNKRTSPHLPEKKQKKKKKKTKTKKLRLFKRKYFLYFLVDFKE